MYSVVSNVMINADKTSGIKEKMTNVCWTTLRGHCKMHLEEIGLLHCKRHICYTGSNLKQYYVETSIITMKTVHSMETKKAMYDVSHIVVYRSLKFIVTMKAAVFFTAICIFALVTPQAQAQEGDEPAVREARGGKGVFLQNALQSF